jgi:hypothetical protein
MSCAQNGYQTSVLRAVKGTVLLPLSVSIVPAALAHALALAVCVQTKSSSAGVVLLLCLR